MPAERKQIIRLTLKRFQRAIHDLAKSRQGPQAGITAAMLFTLMFGINGLNVLNSYVGRDFMSAIEAKDLSAFHRQGMLYILVFLASSVVAALYRFSEERLGILWREQLTWKLTESYLSDRTYYRLDSESGVANPDQRISEDVRAFTTTTLSFLILFLNGTLTAISFSGVLWSISPMLFLVAVGYAIAGSAATIWLGKPLIRLNYNQLDMEANFRSELIHVRENSESIALAHREGRFKKRLHKRLSSLAANFRKLVYINRNLNFFTNSYNYLIQLIPPLLIAPMFISGDVPFGVITQSTMAFATLLGAFSLIVTQFQSISAFTAVTARLHTLTDAIERAHQTDKCSLGHDGSTEHVVYDFVTLLSPDNSKTLVKDLNLEIRRGSRWLVTTEEDSAAVALFRATADVWGCGGGDIERPKLDEILFLPERPYLPPGPLRHALLRTGMEDLTMDAEIHAVLRKLDLASTIERVGGLDAEQDWDDALSISEQHLLSIARLFLAKPAFVFLDRPASSLPRAQLAKILDMLSSQHIGAVIFGKHGESKLRYDHLLEIHAGGSWNIVNQQIGIQQEEEMLKDLSC